MLHELFKIILLFYIFHIRNGIYGENKPSEDFGWKMENRIWVFVFVRVIGLIGREMRGVETEFSIV